MKPRHASPGRRRLAVGAEPGDGGTHFRVWAPDRSTVDVGVEGRPQAPLAAEPDGWFGGWVAGATPGLAYRLLLDGEVAVPDPASRWQPEGPHGPSRVVDPSSFRWTDTSWGGPVAERHVFYEMHVGTFTREGTWAAAADRLPELADLGVTIIEMMPVCDFPGAFGWGYDGVALFAPYHGYGAPDDLRAFVDRAHGLGLGVILDVVYNHLGPDGNYLPQLASAFFSRKHRTDWGDAINFDGPGCAAVRAFYRANVRYWIEEFHVDGFRLDATQDIHDDSPGPHILAELVREARAAAGDRRCVIVGENEPQQVPLVLPPGEGGMGLDTLWNDDFHHTALVALTGRREAYYTDYGGSPQELVSVAKHGFLYQGQWYVWQRKGRGTSTRGLGATAFVHYLENHDQVANSATGARLAALADPARLRAMSAVLLLIPGHALLFQGQEFGSTRPFLFFADHEPDLAAKVRRGRREFLRQFPSLAGREMQARLADPGDPGSFQACVLDDREREEHVEWRMLHRDLIALRTRDPVLGEADPEIDGAVLGPEALVLRWFGETEERLLVVNLGRDLHLPSVPEPLLAPADGRRWETLWSSESPRYGGRGITEMETESNGWRLPGHAAQVLAPAGRRERK